MYKQLNYKGTLIPSGTRSNAKVDVCVFFCGFAWLPIDKKASSFSSKNLSNFLSSRLVVAE